MIARDDARMLRRNAILLAVIAAALIVVALLFGTRGTASAQADRVLLGAAVGMPILLMLGGRVPGAAGLGRVLLVLLPVLMVLLPILTATGGTQSLFDFLRFWPQILAAVAAALALQELAAASDEDSLGADFCLGAALLAGALSLPPLLNLGVLDMAAQVALRTPLHLAITATGFVILAILARAFLTSTLSRRARRFLSGLITLLPLLGFAGTILGIMGALENLPALFAEDGAIAPEMLDAVLGGLAGAFETTLLGLLGAILASFLSSLFDALHPQQAE